MSEDQDLLKLQESLPNFFSYFKDMDVLAISDDKETLPFMFAIKDENYPDMILLSIAIDYPVALNTTEIALSASAICSTGMTEPFYIGNDGTTHMGEEAFKQLELEDAPSLSDLAPPTQAIH